MMEYTVDVTLTYALANFGITLGYVCVAIFVIPHIDVRRPWVRWAGAAFFVTCGITHAGMAVDALAGMSHDGGGWWFANHVIQVVAVWAFFAGLWLEFVKDQK